MPDHPFSEELVATVGEEHESDGDQLSDALDQIQDHVERDGGGYEYSTRHSYGWGDDHAYYLYGSQEIWNEIEAALSFTEQEIDALRDVHYRKMMHSAEERGEEQTVREMLDGDNEPLVVTSLGGGPPSFGREV